MPWFRRTRNLKRRILKRPIGFVHLTIEDKIPVVREPVSFLKRQVFDQPKYSIMELHNQSARLVEFDRVEGLIIELRDFEGGYATVNSLIDLIRFWQENKRPVWIYSNSYSFTTYYLASYADKVYLTTGGTMNTTGVAITASFLQDYIEDKGLEIQIAQVSPYKSALNQFAYNEMPKEQRENLEWLAEGIFDPIVETIAENREKSVKETKDMINSAPLDDLTAKDQGWIDDNFASNQIRTKLDQEYDTELTKFPEAMNIIPMEKPEKPNIAVIPVIGTIVDGKSSDDNFPVPIPIIGGRNAGDQTISQLIRKAKREDNIKAAVLVVNSPGGSATASEVILQEIKDLANKMPLVVYFHNVAASGGYYISMASDYIFAQPHTITASIGVINGKISTDGVYEQRGINRITIQRGENATIQSSIGKWDEEQREVVERGIERIYDVFKDHVLSNRDISPKELDQIAGGRVYLGHQALDKGLIDELGGIDDALEKAAELADLDYPVFAVVSTEKKVLPPENVQVPDVLIQKLAQITGKAQLFPYFILDQFHV